MDAELMRLVQQLARYLRSHPDACDATDGIARWWLPANEPIAAVPQVETALGCLRDCGVVEATHAADGRVRYRRAAVPGATGATGLAGAPAGTSGAAPGPTAADIVARLDALVADPRQALMAHPRQAPTPGDRPARAGGLH